MPKQIPMFKDGKITNPFMSNDQKEVNKTFATEKNVRQTQTQVPSLFEFKINDQVIQYPDPKKPQMSMDPMKLYEQQGIYPSPYVPIPNPFYPNGMNPHYPYAYQMGQMPLIKKYNISISNENGDLTKLHSVYEDVLPQINGITQKTLTTMAERSVIYQYLRSIFVRHNDGEDIRFTQSSNMNTYKPELINLLSHMKIMDFNPYHFSRITNNPYSTIPDNFVMFRSCYPIRLSTNNYIECALDNISLNIRIYQMRVMDLLANKIGYYLEKKDTDLWREIAYYEYVREKILKTNMCPNFVMIYSWYLTQKSGIDFLKLQQLKKDKSANQTAIEKNEMILIKNLKDDIVSNVINKVDDKIENGIKILKTNVKTSDGNMLINMNFTENDLNKINVQYPTNKCIVMITEGPTHNLFDWGTRAYAIKTQPVVKMLQTGYHDIKVWQSIIFQLLAGMYVMQLNGIALNEFSIENNVHIKDLSKDENNIGYWKYKINGMEFYVPNYGYLVVIDSKYQEMHNGIENVDLTNETQLHYMYKIYGTMFNDPQTFVDDLNKKNMLNVFNVNNFGVGFSQYGGIKPPTEIFAMISKINTMISDEDTMTNVFLETQQHFLNNRIGLMVKDIEKDQLVGDNINFKRGEMIAYKYTGDDSFVWSLYIHKSDGVDMHEILTIDALLLLESKTPKLKRIVANSGDLRRVYGYVEQLYKPNQKISEEDILETYIISDM